MDNADFTLPKGGVSGLTLPSLWEGRTRERPGRVPAFLYTSQFGKHMIPQIIQGQLANGIDILQL